MSYFYEHPRPAVTVDCVVFSLDYAQRLQMMPIQRGLAPFKDRWALPGGFVRVGETVLEKQLDKRNFRQKIMKMKLSIDIEEMQLDVSHRSAKLYQFDESRYLALKKAGFNFEI